MPPLEKDLLQREQKLVHILVSLSQKKRSEGISSTEYRYVWYRIKLQ